MQDQLTPIEHSEIFSSEESFFNFFKPIIIGESAEGPLGECKSYQLPIWHPFRRPVGIISLAEIDNGIAKLHLSFSVNTAYDIQTSITNKWMRTEVFKQTLDEMAKYFVNGTIFGTKDGGRIIVNGPKEFTYTFKEPEGQCVSCGEKICEEKV